MQWVDRRAPRRFVRLASHRSVRPVLRSPESGVYLLPVYQENPTFTW
jgi:hypothetical protein